MNEILRLCRERDDIYDYVYNSIYFDANDAGKNCEFKIDFKICVWIALL